MLLKQSSLDEIITLKEKWIGMLAGEADTVIRAEFIQLFKIIESTGCRDNINNCFNKPIYRCIVDDNGKEWGIVEIVLSENGSSIWVKMLDIHLSPEVELNDETEESTKSRLDVFRAALIGIFELTKEIENTTTVKVYGRTDALVSFLRGMHDAFSVFTTLGTIKGIKVSIEGRWLVFHTS